MTWCFNGALTPIQSVTDPGMKLHHGSWATWQDMDFYKDNESMKVPSTFTAPGPGILFIGGAWCPPLPINLAPKGPLGLRL